MCWLFYLLFQNLCPVPKPLPWSEGSDRGKQEDGNLWETYKRVLLELSMKERRSCLQA